MSGSSHRVDYRSASLVLNFVNVTQPVAGGTVTETLGKKDPDSIGRALRFLVDQGLVKQLPHDEYRTTWAGQEAIQSRVLRKSRDIHRMWHLSELSDQLRRSEEGDDS